MTDNHSFKGCLTPSIMQPKDPNKLVELIIGNDIYI